MFDELNDQKMRLVFFRLAGFTFIIAGVLCYETLITLFLSCLRAFDKIDVKKSSSIFVETKNDQFPSEIAMIITKFRRQRAF